MLFTRHLLELVLQGQKTQTRRIHKHRLRPGRTYTIKTSWFGLPDGRIQIKRRFTERLGDISPEDVKKEGFESLADFQQAWKLIHGEWDPELTVTVYEFELLGFEGVIF